MTTIEEIQKEAQKNDEKIIDVNPFFVLSQCKKLIYVRSINGNYLTFENNQTAYKNRINSKIFTIKLDCKKDNLQEELHFSFRNIERYLIFDCENKIIFFYETDNRCIWFNSLQKIIQYDFNLQIIDSYLGRVSISNKEFKISTSKIISLNKDTNYEIYSGDEYDHILNILYNEGKSVNIFSSINGSKKIVHLIDNIKTFFRLTKEEGYYKLLFDYYIIETDKSSILINLKTLKHITISNQVILPTTFNFNSKYYLNKHAAKSLINLYTQYVCVDNKIYDENLNIVLEIKPLYKEKITLLDTKSNYIAVSKEYGEYHNIHIFLVYSNNHNKTLESIEAKYICCYSNSDNRITLKVNDFIKKISYYQRSYNNLISFDPYTNKFIVNTQKIEKDEKRRKENYEVYEHYSIWDAVDGDPEALANLD